MVTRDSPPSIRNDPLILLPLFYPLRTFVPIPVGGGYIIYFSSLTRTLVLIKITIPMSGLEAKMKKLLIVLLVGVGIYTGIVTASTPHIGAMVCVPDGRGGMCCWDTTVEGPFRPISC